VPQDQVRARVGAEWWLRLVVLVSLSELAPFGFNLVTPALPLIAARFETGQVAWVMTVMQLSGACALPLLGRLADAHGKRLLLLASAAIAALGALVGLLAPTFEVLLLGRLLEGAGLGVLPIAYSLIRDVFPAEIVPISVSVAAAGFGLSSILAPLLSAWLIESLGYRGVFAFLLALPLVLGPVVLLTVPEGRTRAQGGVDWLGGLLLSGSFALVLLALSSGPGSGWTSPIVAGGAVAGAALFVIWLRVEERAVSPLIQLSSLRRPPIVTAMVVNVLIQAMIVITAVMLVLVVETAPAAGGGYGLGRTAAGLAAFTVPAGVLTFGVGVLAGAALRRRSPRWLAVCGPAVAGAGALSLVLGHHSDVQVAAGVWTFAIGAAAASAAIPNLVISAAPPHEQAVTASAVGVTGALGAAVGLQLAYVVLGHSVLDVRAGVPVYSDAGLRLVFGLVAVFAAAGILTASAGFARRRQETTWRS
jgi:MFS family permease